MKFYARSPLFAIILIALPIACHSLMCYSCVEGRDHGCGDPFDNTTVQAVDCDADSKNKPHVDPEEHRMDFKFDKAIGCRKILQEIDGLTTVVRQCAFAADNSDVATKRIGNKGVRLFFYQCGKPECNGAQILGVRGGVFWSSAVVIAAASFLLADGRL